MRYGRGLDLRVIAQECGITVELVKTRLHRGRALLTASFRRGRRRRGDEAMPMGAPGSRAASLEDSNDVSCR
jgi:DNA-directed RNA polymerase specialized sigma24 family protein